MVIFTPDFYDKPSQTRQPKIGIINIFYISFIKFVHDIYLKFTRK